MKRALTSNDAKRAAGTYTPTRNHPAPRYKAQAPKMPRSLSAGAKAIWRETVAEMEAAKVLRTIDKRALAMFCEMAADWDESRKPGAKRFTSTETAQYRMLMCELGMTPASRLRTPPIVDDAEQGKCQDLPSDPSSNVVPISKRLSNMPLRSTRGKSTSADTSSAPASDN